MMKKINYIYLLLALSLILCSCSTNKTEPQTSTTPETTESIDFSESQIIPHTKDLSNDIFKLELSDKFVDKFDTVVAPNYIEIYDLESRNNGFEGLLFAICAFENPKDWAGGPHEKVGELELNNGKLYDIIIGYPTEAQYGFDTEMPQSYKTLYDLRYDVAKSLTGLNGEKIEYGKGVSGNELYTTIITELITSLDKNYDSNQFESVGLSPMYGSIRMNSKDYLNKIGYAYKDINVDGIDELLIGEIIDGDEKCVIYDLFTMVDRKPEHVVSGWDRNRYYAVDGSFLLNEYSNSAFESGMTIFALGTNSTELIFQLALKYDESDDENNPYYISYAKTDDEFEWDNIDKEEFTKMSERFDKPSDFKYTPLSDYQ